MSVWNPVFVERMTKNWAALTAVSGRIDELEAQLAKGVRRIEE